MNLQGQGRGTRIFHELAHEWERHNRPRTTVRGRNASTTYLTVVEKTNRRGVCHSPNDATQCEQDTKIVDNKEAAMDFEFDPDLVAQFPELSDPDEHLPGAGQRMLNIIAANPTDVGLTRLAIRIGRDFTTYESGFHGTHQPWSVVMIVGGKNASFNAILDEIAIAAIGEYRPDVPAWHEIRGAEFGRDDEFKRAMLIGPPADSGGKRPELWMTTWSYADFMSRTAEEMDPLKELDHEAAQYFAAYTERLAGLRPDKVSEQRLITIRETIGEFTLKIKSAQQKIESSMDTEKNPPRGIIGFTDIDRMDKGLVAGIVSPILRHGFLTVPRAKDQYGNIFFDTETYRDTMIVFTVRVPDRILRHRFYDGRNVSQRRYERVRRYLERIRSLKPILDELGDRIHVVGDPATESQRVRLEWMLNLNKGRLARLEIKTTYTDLFKEFLVEKSRDPDRPDVFPLNRIQEVVARYVRIPLAQTAARGELRRGCSLIFDAPPEGGDPLRPAVVSPTEESEALTRDQISEAFWKHRPPETKTTESLRTEFELTRQDLEETLRKIEEGDESPEEDDNTPGQYL